MAEYTLRIRRYDPESGEAAHWQDYQVELEPHRSVLEAIDQLLLIGAEQRPAPAFAPDRRARPRVPTA